MSILFNSAVSILHTKKKCFWQYIKKYKSILEYRVNHEVKYLNSKDISRDIVLIFIFSTALNQNLKDN